MKRWMSILLLAVLLAGCREGGIKDYWRVHSIDYSDIAAAEDQFADFAEQAVASPEADACASLDVLFDQLKKDEVAYFLYAGWVNGAFYSILSPCRNASLYAKAVERMTTDGILSEEDCDRYLHQSEWIQFNRKGEEATIPGIDLAGQRTLVLVLDPACSSCQEAIDAMAARPEWADVRQVTVFCNQDNAAEVFDPQLTPVYFVVSADGTVEIPYTPAL